MSIEKDVGAECGARLKEERRKIGITQDDFASLGGVKKLTQGAYEQGKRVPDARYLIAIYNHGVDIRYILTGERSEGYVARLDKNIITSVAHYALEWMNTTEREITPELFGDVLTIFYNAASKGLDEDYMAAQIRAIG